MNFKTVMRVYRKELLEISRDRRALFTTLLLPLILYPLLFVGFSSLMSRQTSKLEKKGAIVQVIDSLQTNESVQIVRSLKTIPNFQYLMTKVNADSMYAAGKIQAIVCLKDSLDTTGMHHIIAQVNYDKSNEKSEMTYTKLSEKLAEAEKDILSLRLKPYHVNAQFTRFFHVVETNTASAQRMLGLILGKILPYLLIMMMISGGAAVATELIAGEKTKKTLETLLVSSAGRNEIVAGKYLTIVTMSFLNVIVNLCSMYFSMKQLVVQSGVDMNQVQFPLASFGLILLALIPFVTLFSAILLSISTFSRNTQEARSYESPLMLVAMMLGMVSFLPGLDLNLGLSFIPVINIALLFKAIMLSQINYLHFFVIVGSTILLDIIAIIVTVHLFNREDILFRSEEEVNLKELKRNSKGFFNISYGLIFYMVALMGLYYLGMSWQKADITSGLIKTQLLIILAPPILLTSILKMKRKEVFRLKKTKPINFLLVLLMSIPALMVVTLITLVVDKVYPIPPAYLKAFQNLLSLKDATLWQKLLLIGLLPGVCEELFFRGFLIRFMEKYSWLTIIILNGFLFAVYHLDIYRLVPVFFLGMYLSYVLLRSDSLYLSMWAHGLNNSIVVLIGEFANKAWLKPFITTSGEFKWSVIGIGVVLFVVILYVFRAINASPKQVEKVGV